MFKIKGDGILKNYLTVYSGKTNITVIFRDCETRFIFKSEGNIAILKLTPIEIKNLYLNGCVSNYTDSPLSYAHIVTKTALNSDSHELIVTYLGKENSFGISNHDWLKLLDFIECIVDGKMYAAV